MMKIQKGVCVFVLFTLIVPLVTCNASGSKIVLVTGFEPFGSHSTNPSQLIAETLNGTTFNSAKIIGIVLPVDFDKSVEKTIEAIQHYQPNVIISLGLAARSKVIKIEKIGINLKRYPKDDGTWSFPQRIDKNGPFLRITSLRTKDIAQEIRYANIPAQQSVYAGSYVCNALFYGLLGYVTNQNVNTTIGFVHVPLLSTQDPSGLPLETMVDAVKIAIEVSLREKVNAEKQNHFE